MTKNDLDILTFLVAVCVLATTFWQGYLARQHNRLIIRPALTWQRRVDLSDGGLELIYSVHNNGVGPAIILDRYFTVRGERFAVAEGEDEILGLVDQVIGKKLNFQLREHGLPGIATAMSAGGSQVIARLFFPNATRDVLKDFEKHVNVGFAVQYESLYKQSWWLRA